MKRPRKLTLNEKKAASAYGLDARNWMHMKDISESYILVIHKDSIGKEIMETRIIDKNARGGREIKCGSYLMQ